MNIKLKKINILEPDIKIKTGVRIAIIKSPEAICSTAGEVFLLANKAGYAIIGDAALVEE